MALKVATASSLPIERLILVGTTPGLRTNEERQARLKFDANLVARLESMSPSTFQQWWSALPIIASQRAMPSPFKERMHSRRVQTDLKRLAQVVKNFGTGSMPPMWTALRELKMPVHILVGANDTKYCHIGAQMAQELLKGTFETIPESGHAPHLERPDFVASRLASILKQIEA